MTAKIAWCLHLVIAGCSAANDNTPQVVRHTVTPDAACASYPLPDSAVDYRATHTGYAIFENPRPFWSELNRPDWIVRKNAVAGLS